jgi:hypothetical protein
MKYIFMFIGLPILALFFVILMHLWWVLVCIWEIRIVSWFDVFEADYKRVIKLPVTAFVNRAKKIRKRRMDK